MSIHNHRQRFRQKETHITGENGSMAFRNVDHSVFADNGDIVSCQMAEASVRQGIVAHQPGDIVAQCQTCREFLTKEMLAICQHASHVVCRQCAKRWNDLTVCPECATYLAQRKKILILKKLFLYPFVERIR